MNKELNIFTLRMLRDQYHAEHLDTEAEALEAAISALEDTDSAYTEGWTAAESKYRDALSEIQSAQPEIIRCRECKHYEADIMANPWGVCCHPDWVVGNVGNEVDETGWCYRAEPWRGEEHGEA